MKRFALVSTLALFLLLIITAKSAAQVFLSEPEAVPERYLLVATASRGSGESQVAVNPLNPTQIAVRIGEERYGTAL